MIISTYLGTLVPHDYFKVADHVSSHFREELINHKNIEGLSIVPIFENVKTYKYETVHCSPSLNFFCAGVQLNR